MPPDALNPWKVTGFALVAGTVVGAAGAFLATGLRPWQVGEVRMGRLPAGPAGRADVAETVHDFGTIGLGAAGAHEFVVHNAGDGPLVLSRGATSCTCTVSGFDGGSAEARKVVEPGASTRVRIEWKGKNAGPFRQQATILTDDPRRPELVFVVEGGVLPTWRAEPPAIHLPRVSASAGEQAATTIFTFGREQPAVRSIAIDHPQAAQFFSLATTPLGADEIAAEPGATGGFRVVLDVKPGLPLGPLRQTISVVLDAPEQVTVELPVEATVAGDLVLAGPGWDSTRQALVLGTVSGRKGLRTRVFLTVKGSASERIRPMVREVDPEVLDVTVGDPSAIGSGGAVRIPLDIVVPPGSRPLNRLCTDSGPAGRIVLDTGMADAPTFTIPVCLAIGP